MSLLEHVRRGREVLPPRLVLYGPEGVGKSTCGNGAPAAVFIDAEGGLAEIDCARFPRAASLDDVIAALTELRATEHGYRTIVLDTADAIERLTHVDVCRKYGVNSIEKASGGYGKGYREAAQLFEKLLPALDALRLEKRMIVIVLAHAKVEKFFDPENGEYDRYSPRLHQTACALLKEWSDAVLFATRRVRVERGDDGDRATAKAVGRGAGDRIIKTEGGPACVAKNRYNMPAEIPLSWDAIYAAIAAAQRAPNPPEAGSASSTPPADPAAADSAPVAEA